ncbi:MAG: tetratricopeptide repeat protein [Candidatus Omnitrophota bacterium]
MKNILISLIFLVLVLLLIHPVDNNDVWMHLKSGELMAKDMRVMSTDKFSYTIEGRPWLNHQWLSQMIFYFFYSKLGLNSLIFLQLALILLAFMMMFKNAYNGRNWLLYVFLTLLIILFSQEGFLVRPLVFSAFLFSVFVFMLDGYKYGRTPEKEKWLYVLIPLQVLWVNLHGAAITGIFLIWAYILGEFIDRRLREFRDNTSVNNKKYKRLLFVGIAVLISAGITPYGYNAILFPIRELNQMYFIREWLPSVDRDMLLNSGDMPYYRLFLLISFFVFVFRGRFIPSAHIIIFAVFLYLSLSSRRHLLFYGIAIAPCIVRYSEGMGLKIITEGAKKILVKTMAVFLCVYMVLLCSDIFSGRHYVRAHNNLRVGMGKVVFPDDAIDFVISSGIKGNMFNDYGSGCYLIWRLYPHKKVFLDGRNTIYGVNFIREQYIAPLNDFRLFERIVEKYGINFVFLDFSLSMGNLTRFIPYLYYSDRWELVFFDSKVCVFVRNDEINRDLINSHSIDLEKKEVYLEIDRSGYKGTVLRDYINRASFYGTIGLVDIAIDILEDARYSRITGGDLFYNLGTLYLKKEKWSDATIEFTLAIDEERNDVDAYNNLGISYANQGQYEKAIAAFRKALMLNPFHKIARKNMKIAVGQLEAAAKGRFK